MISQYADSLLGTFIAHPYIILFVGLLFAGEAFLLPAIYLALRGNLHLSYVVGVALMATLIADVFWYYVGAHMKERFARKLVAGRVQRTLEKLRGAFTKRSGMVLYFSKFVYGTRTAVQVLAGLQAMPLRKYLNINFLGIFSLLMFIVVLAYSVEATVESVGTIIHDVEVAFLLFLAILFASQFFLGSYFKRLWSQ